jgi:hypothetical protein
MAHCVDGYSLKFRGRETWKPEDGSATIWWMSYL